MTLVEISNYEVLKLNVSILGLCIPSNNTIFIKAVSERLGANEPHLTLEFLEECLQGFRNSNIEMKHLCLEYMTPWLPNLTRYTLSLYPYYILGNYFYKLSMILYSVHLYPLTFSVLYLVAREIPDIIIYH